MGCCKTFWENKVLDFNQYHKYDKTTSIIYADFESLVKKVDGCKNNPEKLSIAKIGEHIPCVYSVSTIWTFDGIGNKHDIYRGEDCMEKFWVSLREHAAKIINFEKKKMIPLTNKEYESYLIQVNCHFYLFYFIYLFTYLFCKHKYIQ